VVRPYATAIQRLGGSDCVDVPFTDSDHAQLIVEGMEAAYRKANLTLYHGLTYRPRTWR
jgi:hypothetical protein